LEHCSSSKYFRKTNQEWGWDQRYFISHAPISFLSATQEHVMLCNAASKMYGKFALTVTDSRNRQLGSHHLNKKWKRMGIKLTTCMQLMVYVEPIINHDHLLKQKDKTATAWISSFYFWGTYEVCNLWWCLGL